MDDPLVIVVVAFVVLLATAIGVIVYRRNRPAEEEEMLPAAALSPEASGPSRRLPPLPRDVCFSRRSQALQFALIARLPQTRFAKESNQAATIARPI